MRFLSVFLVALVLAIPVHAEQLLGIRDAQLTMLRVHDVGTGFGPAQDHIDVEVVVQVERRPGAFGFQLRNDRNRAARQGMLDLLRDAVGRDDLRVNLDYRVTPPRQNGVVIRVWLTRAN